MTITTCFDRSAAGRQGAGIQSKAEELEALNHAMRDRDRLKDDAIHPSFYIVTISTGEDIRCFQY